MHPSLQCLMPQHALSRFAGWMASNKNVWLKNQLIRYFINRYPVKMDDALEPDPYQYVSFNAFFTRALRSSTRKISSASNEVISPADGSISQIGNIEAGKILQAKGHYFTANELLGGDPELAKSFDEGPFITVYLAPSDYHRVHMPLDGHLSHMVYIPGKLFSVNTKTAETTERLFARNERVVAIFNTSVGKMAIVLVGAMIVGSIETVWAGTVTHQRSKSLKHFHYDNPIFLKRGEEMGRFKLGSTVIVLFEKDVVNWNEDLLPGDLVQMGQGLGRS